MTGFQGVTVTATAEQLEAIMGKPRLGDDGKVNFEFRGMFNNKPVAVYDWCIGRKIAKDERVTWNIAATSKQQAEQLKWSLGDLINSSLFA